MDIDYEDYLELERDRKSIVENSKSGMRERNHQFKEIPLQVTTENIKADGRVRLKGDRITHFEKDKSSFKITLADEDKIFGIKKFSLMKPRARNYIHEWLFHNWQVKDLIKLINFKLKINGNLWVYMFLKKILTKF